MTRLVGVRAVCDACSSAAAVVFCVSHRSVVCFTCDAAQHSTPATVSHQRVDLASAVTALPFCEYCDDAPATTYCETEGTTFCDKCDRVVHASHPAPAHCRTLISSTLRHRAVEFRGLPANRTTSSSHTHPSSPHPTPPSPAVFRKKNNDHFTHHPPSSLQHQPQQPQTTAKSCHRPQPSQRRRSSKLLTKRKHRRASQRPAHPRPHPHPHPQPVTQPRFSPANVTPAHPSSSILQSGDYPGLLFPSGTAAAPYPAFGTDNAVTAAPSDPLMVDQNSNFQGLQDRSYPSAGGSLEQDLSVLPYGSIDNLDLSGDTALNGLNESGQDSSGSGSSSGRKTPEFEIMQRHAALRPPPNTPQAPNVKLVAAAAAAAAAAGELYLLNSVSSGSGSSREQIITPPLNDVSRAPDPAGVAEAATAAAESAAAAVDMDVAANTSEAVMLKKEPHLSTDVDMQVDEAVRCRTGKSEQVVRHMNEEFLSETGGHGKTSHQQTQVTRRQRLDEATLDEAIRRLDNDTGPSRPPKIEARIETRFHRSTQEPLSREANPDMLGHMPDGGGAEILQRGGPDAMEDLEMPGNEFGMFDSIDLSQFEQNSGGGLGYLLSEY